MIKAAFLGGQRHGQWIMLDAGERSLPEAIEMPAMEKLEVFADLSHVPDTAPYHRERYRVLGRVTGRPYVLLMYVGRA